ncbi:hypothetical protein [Frigidibacter mobilis]|uniref:Uncharacterized protein n=1 Tax=Frigidibacter mobilis TaxID=1335048 RepID=A0A159Z4S8_9RHOB|nr:hypothetical protein [Frigidibacter mobilis]AMY69320.1 hypothetical protein AKL17_2073 [Frigidibacter mobilis]
MTFKIIASALAISAACVVPAVAQDAPPAPTVTPETGLPSTVAGTTLPATNLLIVGGVLVTATAALASAQDGTTSTTATTSTN